jgi:hypothetical protein
MHARLLPQLADSLVQAEGFSQSEPSVQFIAESLETITPVSPLSTRSCSDLAPTVDELLSQKYNYRPLQCC